MCCSFWGRGLSVARGALLSHLLGEDRLGGNVANRTVQTLCRFYVGGNESRQQLFAPSAAARRGEVKREEEKENDGGKEKEASVCACSAPGRFPIILFLLPPSVSSLVAQRSNRTESRQEAFSGSVLFSPNLSILQSGASVSQPSAGAGSQLDDPLAAGVAVVQIQKVRFRIQTVLTCRKQGLCLVLVWLAFGTGTEHPTFSLTKQP